MKSICFLLPSPLNYPIGGYKVVYEYANMFVKDGYEVHIVYSTTRFLDNKKEYGIKKYFRYFKWLLKGYSGRKWFDLNNRIREHLVVSHKQKNVPLADVYIATAYWTSLYLSKFNGKNIKKLYLIQDFENWGVSESFVKSTYNLGLYNISIANWLKDIVEESGSSCIVIQNGFDFDYFKKTMSIANRERHISMLYHVGKRKGCYYGIKALVKLKSIYPDLKATLFGVPDRPVLLPDWINYVQKPDKNKHNKIYNESSIFLAPSLIEGWGLTVGEAMICGAAVVCSEALGFKEMINDNENGLIFKIADVDDIVNKVSLLLDNEQYRIKIASAGNESIQKFTWNNSYNKFKEIIDR